MKRPFRNLYYQGNHTPELAWSSHGHACSERGSIRAAVVRIFVGQYDMCRVFYKGVLIYTIYNTIKGLQVFYGRPSRVPREVPKPPSPESFINWSEPRHEAA